MASRPYPASASEMPSIKCVFAAAAAIVVFLFVPSSARGQCTQPSGSHEGASGVPPFEANESCFVDDDAPNLDLGSLIYQGNADKDYFFHTTRYVGSVDGEGFLEDPGLLLGEGTLAKWVTLTFMARIVRPDVQGKLNVGYLDVEAVLNEGTSGEANLGPLNGYYFYEDLATRDRWQRFEFDVYADDLRYPDDPGCFSENDCNAITPQDNKLTLKFTGSGVCLESHPACPQVEVDWISVGTEGDEGLAWRPTLLLHGLGSTSATMQLGTTVWASFLEDKGLAHHAISMVPHGSVWLNGRYATNGAVDMKERFGVDRIHVTGHSKGGIDGRHSVQFHNHVENLFMLGAPNAGSELMGVNLASFVDLASILTTTGPGGNLDMTTAAMAEYNKYYTRNPKTRYVSLAGVNTACPNVQYAFSLRVPGPDDCVVSETSVHHLPYSEAYSYQSAGYETTHVGLRALEAAVQTSYNAYIKQRTAHDEAPSQAAFAPFASVGPAATFGGRQARTQNGTNSQSAWEFGSVVEDGAIDSVSVHIDDGDTAIVFITWITDDDVDLELVSPSNVRYTSATVDPDVTYEQFGGEDWPKTVAFEVIGPEVGEWLLEVHGDAVADVAGVPVSGAVWIGGAAITMTLETDSDLYASGGQATITATLLDGLSPITDAVVSASVADTAGSSVSVFALVDDGSGDDATAGDGVYTGTYVGAASGGLFPTAVSASRATGTVFNRRQGLTLQYLASSTALTGNNSDAGVDADGDGFYDSLTVTLEITADVAGTYWLVGSLTTGSAQLLDDVLEELDLTVGTHAVDLTFDGRALHNGNFDGPYELRDVTLIEDVTGRPVYANALEHTTASYLHTQFQPPGITLTGVTSDFGTDWYGDSDYEILTIEVGADVIWPGDYVYTAHLHSLSGAFVGGAGGVVNSAAGGAITMTFVVSALDLQTGGYDGPWQLRNLVVSGDNLVTSGAAAKQSTHHATSNGDPEAWLVDTGVIAQTQPYLVSEFGGVALPVTVVGFRAHEDDGVARLVWETLSESELAGFQVEQEIDELWEEIGFVSPAGTGASFERHEYRFELGALSEGVHRFRLKQLDTSGEFQYSDVVEIAIRAREAFAVDGPYPNPMSDSATLSLVASEPQAVTIRIVDVTGRQVRNERHALIPGDERVNVQIEAGGLAPGVYFVDVFGERHRRVLPLVIQR